MNINLSGHHVEVTGSLREYVNTKFAKLERHFDQINNVQVILTVEKLDQKAESTVHIRGGEVFASAINTDMYASIDTLVEKLDRQILKHKSKVSNH